MSRRDRRDGDRRPSERREAQPDDEQQRRPNEPDPQESDSLTALKAILSKVSALLQPLQLNQDESIHLVEQLYGTVLETDVKLAGEADDRRKSSVLAQIQNATITRSGGKIVVEYPSAAAVKADKPIADEPEVSEPGTAEPRAAEPRAARKAAEPKPDTVEEAPEAG